MLPTPRREGLGPLRVVDRAGERAVCAELTTAGVVRGKCSEGILSGPYTRAYSLLADSSVSVLNFWLQSHLTESEAPTPPLTDEVHHGHDLFMAPVVFRLLRDVSIPTGWVRGARKVAKQLGVGRRVTAWISPTVAIGADSSQRNWRGWGQYKPVVVHWRDSEGVAALGLTVDGIVHATAHASSVSIEIRDAVGPLRIEVDNSTFVAEGDFVGRAGRLRIVSTAPIDQGRIELPSPNCRVDIANELLPEGK